MIERWSRFAPSPTGPLHLGNLQTALAAWLQARLSGAGFILRIEDLDIHRCRSEHTESIVRDLSWLGLDWNVGPGVTPDSTWLQSRRIHLYRDALIELANGDNLYPCDCSRRELRDMASAPHGPLGVVYPGTCRERGMPPGFDRDHPDAGAMAVRFRCGGGVLEVDDQVVGCVKCDVGREVGDIVVFRRDNTVAYHLAVVVDDIAMGITDVLRGEDLLWSVFPQIRLYRALAKSPPRYWHVPLRVDDDGRRLSKRAKGETLEELAAAGYRREQVIGLLATGLGLIDDPEPVSLGELLTFLDADSFRCSLRRARPRRNQDA